MRRVRAATTRRLRVGEPRLASRTVRPWLSSPRHIVPLAPVARSSVHSATMPGAPHETMVVLLREHPEWLRALVEVIAHRVLPGKLTLADTTVRVVDPAEVRLDLKFVAEDGSFWVLVEVQLAEDSDKARKWPLAVAANWNQHGVPGDLIVITADRAVATWAHAVGAMLGPSGTTLGVKPVVVQLTGNVAELLLDPARPELAFFAAWTVHDRYGDEAQAIVERAAGVILTIEDESLRSALLRYILGMLHEKLTERIREIVMNPQNIPVSPAFQRLSDELEARGAQRMILKILTTRKLPVTDVARERLAACTDGDVLDRWAERAVTAATIDEVFAD